ncbi:MAG: spermidine synthase [Spirochaetae bacterium HGW-Spirochaetae-1]|nr:MAG: spermidine synthase [Spirochaetae bacterium HGW-Spirochaetae-1]
MKDNFSLSQQRILLFSIFVLSLCGITYELVLGSLATYLLGNPVQQYSITIGVFLSSMGLGSWLSRYVLKNILRNFIWIEVTLGLVGGVSVIILNYLFSFSPSFYLLHVFLLSFIGMLVGLEIPLLTRILRGYGSLKDVLSNVLTLDYMGGLAGSLLFPLVLFPFLGRIMTSLVIGIANAAVAVIIVTRIKYSGKRRIDYIYPLVVVGILTVLVLQSGVVTDILEKRLYYDDIVFSRRSTYQEIVLTRNGDDFRLYLDGSLQFSTYDEYRYHEMLVYPPLAFNGKGDKQVLVMGGGDGLALRELVKQDDVRSVTLVELDPMMLDLARNNSSLKRINGNSLVHPKVNVVAGDAYDFLVKSGRTFDIIIADFPDPHDETISKLYTVQFFKLVKRSMAPGAIFVSQSTSPLFAREAFWCIHNTMKKVFPHVVPYHVFVPTFGDWGYNMASFSEIKPKDADVSRQGLRFFTRETFVQSQHFPPDCGEISTEINTFNRPVLYTYYIKGWKNVDY